MPAAWIAFLVVFGAGIAAIYLRDAVGAWRHWRGVRLVTCPETSRTAAVTIDAAHAATTAFFESAPDLRLSFCSRWPTRGECRAPCLPGLSRAGDDAKVETLMRGWYSTHRCALCGQTVRHVTSHVHPPALLAPDGITVEWPAVAPERLVDTFATHHAVCSNCHLAATFRREYPEFYVDRPGPTLRRH